MLLLELRLKYTSALFTLRQFIKPAKCVSKGKEVGEALRNFSSLGFRVPSIVCMSTPGEETRLFLSDH